MIEVAPGLRRGRIARNCCFFCRRGMGMTRRYCKGKRAASLVGVFARGPGPPCEINDLVACVCELTGARVLCCFAIGGAQHIGDRLLESTGGLSSAMRTWKQGHL